MPLLPESPGTSAFPSLRHLWHLWLAGLWCLCALTANAGVSQPRGLPFIRSYPLDEIGNVPRNLRLGFDSFGRVAVMYDGIYAVLNDSSWGHRIKRAPGSKELMTSIKVANGKYYYGGRGSWGAVEFNTDGSFKAAPFVPADAPSWTSVTPFNSLLATSTGMYFHELNGIVYWDFAKRRNTFFDMPHLSAAFPLGDRVFVSCQDLQVRELLPASGTTRITTGTGLENQTVDFAAPLDSSHALLALKDGRLVSFDGETAVPWRPQADNQISGRISAMERLIEGGVAIAIEGKGVYLFSAEGELMWSLMVPELRRIGSMASGEPGVLWVAGENAVHRIYFDSPLTSFGQQLGLTAVFPHVEYWNNKIAISSYSSLYSIEPTPPGVPPTIRLLASKPTKQVAFIAASGTQLLAGNPDGVFSVSTNGNLTPVIQIGHVAGLEFIQPDTCIVIGNREITALKFADGKWTECASRIAGIGDSPVHTQRVKQNSVWIEMGGDRVARLTLRNGVLNLQRITLPWRGEQWTNVGVLGDTVIFSGATGQRAYYDDAKESLCEAPHLDKLLSRSPYWLLRIKEDAGGILWGTYAQGVVTFTPQGDDYAIDATTFELRNDSYPVVTILPDNDIWIAAGRSLYHVEQRVAERNARARTMLVSLVAERQNLEVLSQTGLPVPPPEFSFDDNTLCFRFFSGTYAWRFPPLYEYRLGPSEPWTTVEQSLMLRFPKLSDGNYLLEVRQAGPRDTNSPPFAFPFVIRPPWYRTPSSYAVYALALLLSFIRVARWINHRSLKRNAELEHLVQQRTSELEVTMEKLNEETRNAATLAERSRLAGEIHDSVQQGLSGAILHLDTTMTHPSIIPEVHSQLNNMRNMLSYSREEVQQAVWNLESPLLQNSTLGDALRKLVGNLNSGGVSSGPIEIKVIAHAEPASLAPAIQHNLLRIAQEAVTNAVKHANAGLIEVTLRALPYSVILSVSDNGRGFDPAVGSKLEGHFGLRGIRSRAKAIKGSLQIISSPGAGTTIQVTVPVKELLSHDSSS